jgi:hypothetical protein
MNKQRTIRRTLLAMAIAAMGASGTALADETEVEGNDSFDSPQRLEVGSGGIVTILGRIGNGGSPDVDYYSFERNPEAPDLTVDIDTNEFADGLDSVLHVFSPDGRMVIMSRNAPPEAGSDAVAGSNPPMSRDSYIKYSVNAPGVWKVAVTREGTFLTHQGAFLSRVGSTSGRYKLIVSGLKSSIERINVEIKPGDNELAPINPRAKGVVPVMLMSNPRFDPFLVDVASLRFGRMGNEASYARCAKEGADHNGDNKPDRMCHFHNEKAGFRRGDSIGIVTGTFNGGSPFEGHGDLKIVPEMHDE